MEEDQQPFAGTTDTTEEAPPRTDFDPPKPPEPAPVAPPEPAAPSVVAGALPVVDGDTPEQQERRGELMAALAGAPVGALAGKLEAYLEERFKGSGATEVGEKLGIDPDAAVEGEKTLMDWLKSEENTAVRMLMVQDARFWRIVHFYS